MKYSHFSDPTLYFAIAVLVDLAEVYWLRDFPGVTSGDQRGVKNSKVPTRVLRFKISPLRFIGIRTNGRRIISIEILRLNRRN